MKILEKRSRDASQPFLRHQPVQLAMIIISLLLLLLSFEPALTSSLGGGTRLKDNSTLDLSLEKRHQVQSPARGKELRDLKASKADHPPTTGGGTTTRAPSSTPAANTSTTLADKRRPGLITRATDAIYKTLTGYFSHDDDDEEDGHEPREELYGREFGAKLGTTTVRPSSTTKEATTTTKSATRSTPKTTTHSASTTKAPPTRPPIVPSLPPTKLTPATGKTSHASATTASERTTTNAVTSKTTSRPTIKTTHLPLVISTQSHAKTTITSTSKPHHTSRTSLSSAVTESITTAKPITIHEQHTKHHAPSLTTTLRPKLSPPPHFHLNYSDLNYEILPVSSPPRPLKEPLGTTSHKEGHEKAPTTLPPPPVTSTKHVPHETTTRITTQPPSTSSPTSPTPPESAMTTTSTPLKLQEPPAGDDTKHFQEVNQNSTTSTFSSSVHLFSLLTRAFTSISSELTFLNRTTRLAHDKLDNDGDEHEDESAALPGGSEREDEQLDAHSHQGSDSSAPHNELSKHSKASERLSEMRRSTSDPDGTEAATGPRSQQQITSREDILLLCKLLHKHLDQSMSNSTATNSTHDDAFNLHKLAENLGQLTDPNSKAKTSTTTSTTSKPAARQVVTEVSRGDLGADSSTDRRWLVSDPRAELNEQSHGDRLLESVFALEARATSGSLNKLEVSQREPASAYEEAGLRLLSDLYNLAHERKISGASVAGPVIDEAEGTAGPAALKNISLSVWSKTMTEGHGGRLKLVYWLLERLSKPLPESSHGRPDGAHTAPATKFKVLELTEAHELLDQLDHSLVQQTINEVRLVRPRGVLVASYKRDSEPFMEAPPPRVIDDSLLGGSGSQAKGPPSTLQLIIDRFSQASFGENFHLYLILFVVILFVIILCIAIPALCCKCMMPTNSLSSLAKATNPNRPQRAGRNGGARRQLRNANATSRQPVDDSTQERPRRGFYRSTDPLRESISSISGALAANRGDGSFPESAAKSGETPAIWRKLSNSTTTMTKDEIRTLENNGELIQTRGTPEEQAAPPLAATNRSKFEWYTFEDNKEQTIRRRLADTESRLKARGGRMDKPTQTVVVRDQCKVTKSVQTYGRGQDDLDSETAYWDTAGDVGGGLEEHIADPEQQPNMAYRDRLETRNSNTLTKSELVMLKEKLIPIGQQLREEHDRKQQGAAVYHDYINTALGQQQQHQVEKRQLQQATKPPSRHIDSSSVDSSNGQGRGRSTGMMGGSPPGIARGGSGGEQPKRKSSDEASESQRAPSMRYLELPSHTQGKVDAIKSELDKLEARDSAISTRSRQAKAYSPSQDLVGTYKRYDVI